MALARIRRIKKIGNYRLFQSWTDEGRPKEFARVNLVYGSNGSGKSTLASLLRDCALPDSQAPVAQLELEVELAGSRMTVSETDATFWPRVRVFSADYVWQNLRFDDANGPSPDSLLTLGKPNLETEEKLKTATERLAKIQPRLEPARRDARSAESQLEQRLTALAGTVVNELRSSAAAKYRATNTYTKAAVRALLDGDQKVFDGASSDVTTDVATALSSPKLTPNLQSRESMRDQIAVGAARQLLDTSVVVQEIETLRDHADRAEWVQEGIPLHDGLDACLFCGQPLTQHRRDELTAHFDDSFTALQSEIDTLAESFKASLAMSKSYQDQIPGDNDLYSELAGELQMARSGYKTAHDAYAKAVGELTELLSSKRSNPFRNPILAKDFVLVPPPTADVEAVVKKHEDKSATHAD